MAGRGDKFDHARGADRQAIERGEDDGMIVNQRVVSSAHNRRDFNAISGR
jgi:hypothetical protein